MTTSETSLRKLGEIKYDPSMPTDKLVYNKLNPRATDLIPEDELKLDELCNSILEIGGILVPLVVFPHNDKYVVLDGERRLRAARKLNMKTVPVNIVSVPLSDPDNLSRMFNIHLQREQWNTAARAVSLGKLGELLPNKTEEELRAMAGMDENEHDNALRILSFPPSLQKRAVTGELNSNYLIEMAKAVESLQRYYPELVEKYGRDYVVDRWVSKIDRKIIKNNTHFRIVSRICKRVTEDKAIVLVSRLIEDSNYRFFEDAWDEAEEEIAADMIDIFRSRCEKFVRDLHNFPIRRQSPSEIAEIKEVLTEVISKVKKKLDEVDSHEKHK